MSRGWAPQSCKLSLLVGVGSVARVQCHHAVMWGSGVLWVVGVCILVGAGHGCKVCGCQWLDGGRLPGGWGSGFSGFCVAVFVQGRWWRLSAVPRVVGVCTQGGGTNFCNYQL